MRKSHIKETDYPQRRGLSEEVIERFKLGYGSQTKRLIIPITAGYYKARATDESEPKYLIPKGAKTDLYNKSALREAKPVFIVEGEIDALSIIEAGGNHRHWKHLKHN